jgi:exopolysaccharide biosynthesis polyprenyl glycosylphosphotransferase
MTKIKKTIILGSDIVILYISLFITLIIRYGLSNIQQPLNIHLQSFSFIFIIWIIILYLTDLYKEKYLRINLLTLQILILAVTINITISIIFFYLFPEFFRLTPKTNLLILGIIFTTLDIVWRMLLFKIYISSGWKNNLIFIGTSPTIQETINYLKDNPHIGYNIAFHFQELPANINEIIKKNNIHAIVLHPFFRKKTEVAKTIYQLIATRINLINFVDFYETLFQKLPLEELDEAWFIEKITIRRNIYDSSKRVLDILLSCLLGLLLLPFTLLIAISIKLSARQGPVVYKQQRMGINNQIFTLYKFGTMICDRGPLWTEKNDNRLTKLGKFLRYTHLDEIPQLYNIFKGDMSFIGPRAERKELAALYNQLPYYEIRHFIKPGLTGWAQVNYKPSASIKEAEEKLRYDLYYIKNRSLILDCLILIKTIKYLFINH